MNASFSPKRPLIAGFITLTILLGGFGLWSVVTEISGAIVAPGRIEVEQNRQIVQHPDGGRSEEHTSELQSRIRMSYAVFCLKKQKLGLSREFCY